MRIMNVFFNELACCVAAVAATETVTATATATMGRMSNARYQRHMF